MFVPLSYNLRSLARRRVRTALTVFGIAAVISVYVVMNSVSVTMRTMFAKTGQPDELLITQAGSINPEFSSLPRGAGTYLRAHPRVAADAAGEPLVSPELYIASRLARGGKTIDVLLRGVAPIAAKAYRQVRVPEGTFAGPGRKVLVGKQLAATAQLKAGDVLDLESERWTVVGVFDAGGTVYEQEVWLDLDELGAATNRADLTNFFMRVKSADDGKAAVEELTSQRSEPMQAMTAPAAYARVGGMSIWMAALGQFIALTIALGAIFGGMNTMYAAVASRVREIGILRALGYRSSAVLLSFLLESVAIGLAGGVFGALFALGLAQVPLDIPFFLSGATSINPSSLAAGFVLAGAVGLLGGFFPAWQASRVKVVDVLR
jgi:ABC-type lipoprotein release transport system permease subunit